MVALAYNPTWEVIWHGRCMHMYAPQVTTRMHGESKLDHSLWIRKLF
jgi:hypothetical protein